MFELTLLSLLLLPLVIPMTVPARRARAAVGTRLNPRQASAVEAAVARVVTAGPEYRGNTLQLPCRECGGDSPPAPFERAGLVPLGHLGYVITMCCSACGSPLISRRFDAEYAEYARKLGVIDGELFEAELLADLARLP